MGSRSLPKEPKLVELPSPSGQQLALEKICFTKEFFKADNNPSQWIWLTGQRYTVNLGYRWQLGDKPKIPWARLVWARSLIPRHAFITWIFAHRRLPTKSRLARFQQQDTTCSMCHNEEEDDQHLFFNCHYAQEVWSGILDWWDLPIFQAGHHWMDPILTGGST